MFPLVMMPLDRHRATRYSFPLIGAVLALTAAVIMTLQLQRLLVSEQQQRLRQVTEDAVQQAAATARAHLTGALLEVIRQVRHPELRRFELPVVADYFGSEAAREHREYRFFLWHEQFPPEWQGHPLFYTAEQKTGAAVPLIDSRNVLAGSLVADPAFGPLIWKVAAEHAPARPTYTISDAAVNGRRYQLVVHYFYHDPLATTLFALNGYVVDLAELETNLVARVVALPFSDGEIGQERPPLHLTIADERGRLVYGQSPPPGAPSSSATLDMTAFAETGLPGWVVRRPPPRPWTFTVSASEPSAAFALTNSWAVGAVLMIGVAVVFTAVAIRQVARLSHMQADFVTNVSHQLKTPITILSGVTETLCHGRVTSPEKVTEYAEVAHLQTKRLASLVDRIVIFSKAHDAGRAHFELIDFSRLVSVAVATFRQRPGPTAHITERIDSRPMFVLGDVDALEHVVINLLENAVKYGGGPASEVIVKVAQAGAEVTLSIEDRGAGIDPSEVGRVFEKFYRGKTDRHKAGGFGLGLAIVRQAVTAHGGRVAVVSQPGKGSEFTVSLPVVREESAHALARADR